MGAALAWGAARWETVLVSGEAAEWVAAMEQGAEKAEGAPALCVRAESGVAAESVKLAELS